MPTATQVTINERVNPGLIHFDHFDGKTYLNDHVIKWLRETDFRYFVSIAFHAYDDSNNLRIEFEDEIEAKLFCMNFNV